MDRIILFVMEHPLLIGLFITLLILLIFTEKRKSGRPLTNQELVQLLNKNQAVIVDLRDEKTFLLGHITHSINIPHIHLKDHLKRLEKHKEHTIIFVCNHGQHSGAAIAMLAKQDFKSLLRLQGGIQGWISERLPLIRG